jgi:hypothetical protein
MAKLCELIASVDQMDPEDVICAKPEWQPDSEARVFRLTEDYCVPDEAKAQGYEYFLEADVIRQVLEEFRDRPDTSIEEKCKRIIHYAKFDA